MFKFRAVQYFTIEEHSMRIQTVQWTGTMPVTRTIGTVLSAEQWTVCRNSTFRGFSDPAACYCSIDQLFPWIMLNQCPLSLRQYTKQYMAEDWIPLCKIRLIMLLCPSTLHRLPVKRNVTWPQRSEIFHIFLAAWWCKDYTSYPYWSNKKKFL